MEDSAHSEAVTSILDTEPVEAVAEEAQPEPEKKSEPAEEAGLKRLMAREEEVRAKEADFDRRVAEAVARKVPDLRGKSAEEVLTSLGVDVELAFKEMLYNRASDGNPVKAKLKEELRDYQTKKELDTMRRELETRDMAEAQRKYFDTVSTGAREYVQKLDEKVAPTLATVVKGGKSDWAHSKILGEIVRDAQDRLARGEGGDVLSYAEAAARVESDIKALAEVFTARKDADQGRKAANLNSPSIAKPKTTAVPVKTHDDLVEDAIQSAMKTWARSEAGRRK
jgi:hypothetical protein